MKSRFCTLTVPHLRPYSVAAGDFDNDGLHDIIVVFSMARAKSAYLLVMVISADFGTQPFLIVLDDLDNNKKLDFAVANERTDNLQVYLLTFLVSYDNLFFFLFNKLFV